MKKSKMSVPYLDVNQAFVPIADELQQALLRVLKSGKTILGPEVRDFEEQYAKFCSSAYCVGVGNGLDGLVIALETLHIGKGDEVIVPSNTYIASPIAVSRVGAIPIFVEPKIDTYNIDPLQIERAITKRTKAIMPVHLFGQACEMDAIVRIGKKHKVYIVEDNAQSHGASYKKKITGSFGDINATSFYPGKNLGAIGDAGAITTNNKKLYQNALEWRNYGERKKYYNNLLGYNSRLDEVQAAFLKVKLRHLGEKNKLRKKIAQYYFANLVGVGDIILPKIAEHATHIFHVFTVRTKKRNALQKYLTENNIITLIHYPLPPHLQKAYKYLGYKRGDFPIAEELAQTSLSLPIFPEMSQQQLDYVVHMVKNFFSL